MTESFMKIETFRNLNQQIKLNRLKRKKMGEK